MSEQFIRRLIARDSDGIAYQIDYFRKLRVIRVAVGRPRRIIERVFKCNGHLLRRIGAGFYEMDAAQGAIRLTLDDPDGRQK